MTKRLPVRKGAKRKVTSTPLPSQSNHSTATAPLLSPKRQKRATNTRRNVPERLQVPLDGDIQSTPTRRAPIRRVAAVRKSPRIKKRSGPRIHQETGPTVRENSPRSNFEDAPVSGKDALEEIQGVQPHTPSRECSETNIQRNSAGNHSADSDRLAKMRHSRGTSRGISRGDYQCETGGNPNDVPMALKSQSETQARTTPHAFDVRSPQIAPDNIRRAARLAERNALHVSSDKPADLASVASRGVLESQPIQTPASGSLNAASTPTLRAKSLGKVCPSIGDLVLNQVMPSPVVVPTNALPQKRVTEQQWQKYYPLRRN